MKGIWTIKRMYRYMLRTFVPLLVMTFGISWFIVLMQFLWKYVDDMVGKGLSIIVLAKLLFYAVLHLVPLALPLGILLASLITFGNMGERLELLAMKSAGVPLHKIMKPLFGAVLTCAIGLFFFQNHTMVTAQVKLYTIIYSARYATPELDIPEGTFFNGIRGYNLFVKEKDNKRHLLKQVMIYDHSQGFENARIIRADSGRLTMDNSRTFLTLTLYSGESFETLRPQSYRDGATPVPYANENFGKKEIIIPFKGQFEMRDEGDMRSTYVGKNMTELTRVADSAMMFIDSMSLANDRFVRERTATMRYYGAASLGDQTEPKRESQDALADYTARMTAVGLQSKQTADSLWGQTTPSQQISALRTAVARVEAIKNDLAIRDVEMSQYRDVYRKHTVEWHRRFTFPVACLVFFFIGAPLGAIIRRGGLGTPLVASVLLFVVYYMIDTLGHNMAKSGSLIVWQGVWLSTGVLLPIGIFLTYKASRDSATLSLETYGRFFKKLFKPRRIRVVDVKEVVIIPAQTDVARAQIAALELQIKAINNTKLMSASPLLLWLNGADNKKIAQLSEDTDRLVDYLRDSEDRLIIAKLWDIPLLPHGLSRWLVPNRSTGILLRALLPISLPIDLYLNTRRRHFRRDLSALADRLRELDELLLDPKNEDKQ